VTAKPKSEADEDEKKEEEEEKKKAPSSDDDDEAEAKDPKLSDDSAYRGSTPGGKVGAKPAPSIWHRATYRWTAITTVMAALLVLYTQHPYYQNQQFAPFRPYYTAAFVLWLVLGLPYCKVTLEKFGARRYQMRDGGLHLLMLAKAFQEKKFWRRAKNPRVRTTLLGIGVKGFFTPLMTGFLAGHLNSASRAWLTHKHLSPIDINVPKGASALKAVSIWWTTMVARIPDLVPSGSDIASLVQPWAWTRADLNWGCGIAYDIVFIIDCGWALFGYSTESRWLGNKTRSVEPTGFGWVVCIFCYPPFNNILGTYLPLDNGPMRITDPDWQVAFRAITVFLFAIYASATVAFGFRFSNLTNRGIVTRGPYRFVRHPAYLCKCTAWWLEHIPTMTITKALFLTLLCGVYSLRAWTEERHLGMDPEYRAYKKKTPWIFIPGVY
jgi:protein-S-isoprenylcysteine O-methyltransferase Ste14